MARRKQAVALAATMVLAVVALGFGATGGAVASVDQFNIDGDSATSDDGSLDGLTVSGSGSYTYDGLEAEASTVVTTVEVKNPDGSWSTIATDNTGVSGHAGSVSGPLGGDVFADSQWSSSDVQANTDGNTKDTTLTFRLTVEVKSGGGSVLASDQDTEQATVSVTNEPVSTSATADGGLDASATNEEP